MPPFYIVLDLEATCCNANTIKRHQMEIIEIGAVAVSRGNFEVLDRFQSLVRPVFRPKLTSFCTRLTSITQEQVDGAPDFPEACEQFRLWLEGWPGYAYCSWTDFDKMLFKNDCKRHGLAYPLLGEHLDLKRIFRNALGLRRRPGLKAAIAHVGLEFEGDQHRALDDALNTARLLPFIWPENLG